MANNTNSKPRQADQILYHLRHIGPLTSMEAFDLYGCSRLASRICELRQAGHRIETRSKACINRAGDRTVYAAYQLEA